MTKYSRLYQILFIFIFINFNHNLTGQLSNQAQLSLLTCDPGDDLFAIFGHSAIRVYDPLRGIDEIYSYGTFDFDDPDFYTKFLRGKLKYWLNREDSNRFFRTYDYLKRSVINEEIQLDSIQKNTLYAAILANYRIENRYYLYDFLYDNCSTRIGDILEDNFGPYEYRQSDAFSFRDELHEYLIGRDWTRFGIDLIIGSRADVMTSTKQQMFLPDYLSSNLSTAKNTNNEFILSSAQDLVRHPRIQSASFFVTPILVFTILLVLELIFVRYNSNKKWVRYYDNIWLSILAICSLILLFMWFGTDHLACSDNYNLLVFSPFILFLGLGYIFRINEKLVAIISTLIVLPYIFLPFINMGAQNINSAVLLIALITLMKLFRKGNLRFYQKYV